MLLDRLLTAFLLVIGLSVYGQVAAEVVINPAEPPMAASAELPKWQTALVAMRGEQQRIAACLDDQRACSDPSLAAWRQAMLEAVGLDPRRQLDHINRFINRRPYVSDTALYSRSDYWASPLAFLALGGDCEDYAIAKYAMLRQLGWSRDALRIVVVEDVIRDLPHAVLAVNVSGVTLVLDNTQNAILEGRGLSRYRPYFGVNETSGWIHRRPHTG